MLRAMAHRGPDGSGTLTFPGGAAGMVRLALVDLSERGQQPLWSPDRDVAILFNGELYGFRADREDLARDGYPFRSTTDSEVALALYLRHGPEFVRRVRGMFALAIFDFRGRSRDAAPALVLARDPLGMKPLYLAERPSGQLVFASELKALLASGLVPATVDHEALRDYLAHGYVAQPRSMLEGVRLLAPGTLEHHADGRVRTTRFWRLPAHQPRRESLARAGERLRAVLEESVELHARADAPVGVFLSGGVDSAAIYSLMRRKDPGLRAFTLEVPDSPFGDESAAALATARALDGDTTLVTVTGRDVAADLPAFVRSLDQPSTDGLNTWLISRGAAKEVKGALSGLGGDEWFAGYVVTRRMHALATTPRGRVQRLRGHLAHRLLRHLPLPARARLARWATQRAPDRLWQETHRVFPWNAASRLVGLPALDGEATLLEATLDRMSPNPEAETAVGTSCLLDVGSYMGSQLLRDSDACSMAHSLEIRLPLVDVEVAAFARSCADRHKLPRGQGADAAGKAVLLEALRGLLPEHLSRGKKRGFSLPLEHWLRTELRGQVEELTAPETVAARGLMDPGEIAGIFSRRWGGEPGVLYRGLWSVLIFELWCREVLDSAHTPTSC
jgi:asparagine synthase (glutamine-hydrolysing)